MLLILIIINLVIKSINKCVIYKGILIMCN